MTLPWRSAEDLHLDVPRAVEVPLDVDRGVAEGGLGLALGGLERAGERRGAPDHAQAAPAAAGPAFTAIGQPTRSRQPQARSIVDALGRAGHDGHARGRAIARRRPCRRAHRLIAAGGGPIQTMPAASQAAANRRSRPGSRSRGGPPRRRRAAPRRRAARCSGSSRRRARADQQASSARRTCSAPRSASEYTADRAHAELVEAADDAHGDLAAVRDQHLVERPRPHRQARYEPCGIWTKSMRRPPPV